MNVYSLGADSDHYQNLTLVNEECDWETMYQFNGKPIGPAWRPLRVESLYEDDLSVQPPSSDCPSLFAGVPTLSLRAAEVLRPILDGNGELLKLDCNEADYFIFNVTRVVDALNDGESKIVRLPDGKRVLDIKRFVFLGPQLEGVDIFKLPQQPLGRAFVTDKFVEAVKNGGLVGFNFEWLWASDQRSSSRLLQSTKLQ